jgi:hypothetical protein
MLKQPLVLLLQLLFLEDFLRGVVSHEEAPPHRRAEVYLHLPPTTIQTVPPLPPRKLQEDVDVCGFSCDHWITTVGASCMVTWEDLCSASPPAGVLTKSGEGVLPSSALHEMCAACEAGCGTSSLPPNAAGMGDCSVDFLLHGESCTYDALPSSPANGLCESDSCSLFTCDDGTLTGSCPATCDASGLLANAIGTGDCPSELTSGSCCTPSCDPGYYPYPSTCLDGILTPGSCTEQVRMPDDLACRQCRATDPTWYGQIRIGNYHGEIRNSKGVVYTTEG